MPDYGWLSLLPPLLAIILAIATRRILWALFLGVVLGAFIIAAHQQPFTITGILLTATHTVTETFEGHLWPALADSDHLRVFAFTALMGAMVGVIHRGGGMQGLVECLLPLARGRRGGQLVTWLLGLLVFFDDYANTLLLGGTMRPLTDRLKISREKLAYLVDSTAAPVAGLAIVSTWVAGEIGYIDDGLKAAGIDGGSADGFTLFVASIPYRFYVLWALALVPIVSALNRDFGPMLSAEQNAQREPNDPGTAKELNVEQAAHHWVNAVVPVAVVVFGTLALLLATGRAALQQDGIAQPTILQTFGNGDSYLSLVYGSLAGLIAAWLLARREKTLTAKELIAAAASGVQVTLPALAILWLAWSLSGITGDTFLGTGHYLGGQLSRGVPAAWMPSIVFLLSSVVAFATGTSWGTMGILMPIVIPAMVQIMGVDSDVVQQPVFVATIGSVLAGAIFGDHCSPISDTTVLSSAASECDHVAHVRTQLPYATAVAAVSIICGTIPAGWNVSPWLLLPTGLAALLAIVLCFGRHP